MASRISKLESASEKAVERLNSIDLKLTRIETKLDHLEKDAVTKDGMKAAISEAKNSIIMWVVGALFLSQLLPALLKKFGL